MIKKFKDFINESDGSTTSTVGSGTAVGGGAEGSFVSSAGVSVYGGDSGSAFGTNSSSSGMGPIISAQPSNTPGDVAGSTIGSGDIGYLGGIYTNAPATINRRKKKNKKDKKYYKKGRKIDSLYITKYTEKYDKNNNLIVKFDKYTESLMEKISIFNSPYFNKYNTLFIRILQSEKKYVDDIVSFLKTYDIKFSNNFSDSLIDQLANKDMYLICDNNYFSCRYGTLKNLDENNKRYSEQFNINIKFDKLHTIDEFLNGYLKILLDYGVYKPNYDKKQLDFE
jgi:hypothetical protein